MRQPHLTREAEDDLASAFDHYEAQLAGLGQKFVATFEQQLDWILENPRQYQVYHRGVRRAVMRRFPYAVFYLLEGEDILILSIEHQARRPDRWKHRRP